MMNTLVVLLAAATAFSPEVWFHLIGGNASKEGVIADLDAIQSVGIQGIQLFHGGWPNGSPWPDTKAQIPCLSENWDDLIGFIADECAKRGLTYKMQNCPGWSMSGGPWVPISCAMRKLVAFEPDSMPKWDADDDYHEIARLTFPIEESADGTVRSVTFPNPQQLNHHWCYEPGIEFSIRVDGQEKFHRICPVGAWHDKAGMTFTAGGFRTNDNWKLEVKAPHGLDHPATVALSTVRKLDHWEAKAGWGLRDFRMSTDRTPVRPTGMKTLVFGHVNAKIRNHPAPANATGWECDKLDPRGFTVNFEGYLGRLMKGPLAGGKLKGFLVDSWECGVQSWTWRMEEEFLRLNGYELRPWLPALFGYVLHSEHETERFLLDWRKTCSRLVEDNYFGTMQKLARRHGLSVQFETAFGDVLPGDLLRFWKYADEPMCEFWSPFDDSKAFVGSHDFKPVRPCVSAAHVYGKKRVSAEAFTSFNLTFDETMQELKENANRHFARGVTHLVFQTYTHNPVVNGKPPSSSFGAKIGTPFLRRQTWWPYMKEFCAYLENCCRELERGKPVVDILWYLGDALAHKPSEKTDLFGNAYKYDYLNQDALLTRTDVRNGRIVLPDGMSYRVLWIPEGTFLEKTSETRIAELERKGARVVRGKLEPDWMPQLTGGDVRWYERVDGDEHIYFVAAGDRGFRGTLRLREVTEPITLDLARGESRFVSSKSGAARSFVRPRPARICPLGGWTLPLGSWKDLPGTREERAFSGTRTYCVKMNCEKGSGRVELDLGRVCHWATVFVNGRQVARLWSEPYRCDITDALVNGENEIRVDVTSTWHNRLVYDAGLPEHERKTWTLCGPQKNDPLTDSGLLGPVNLLFTE